MPSCWYWAVSSCTRRAWTGPVPVGHWPAGFGLRALRVGACVTCCSPAWSPWAWVTFVLWPAAGCWVAGLGPRPRWSGTSPGHRRRYCGCASPPPCTRRLRRLFSPSTPHASLEAPRAFRAPGLCAGFNLAGAPGLSPAQALRLFSPSTPRPRVLGLTPLRAPLAARCGCAARPAGVPCRVLAVARCSGRCIQHVAGSPTV